MTSASAVGETKYLKRKSVTPDKTPSMSFAFLIVGEEPGYEVKKKSEKSRFPLIIWKNV